MKCLERAYFQKIKVILDLKKKKKQKKKTNNIALDEETLKAEISEWVSVCVCVCGGGGVPEMCGETERERQREREVERERERERERGENWRFMQDLWNTCILFNFRKLTIKLKQMNKTHQAWFTSSLTCIANKLHIRQSTSNWNLKQKQNYSS